MGSLVRTWALPAVLAVLTLVDVAWLSPGTFPEPVEVTVLVLVAAALSLGWRVARPVLTTVVASALVTGYLLLLHRDLALQPALEPFLVMLVAFFSLGLHADRDALPLGLAAAGLPLLAAELAAVSAGRPLTDLLPTLVFWGTAVVLGRVLHQRSRDADAARARAAEAEREAIEAAAAERTRIARELHDVVAHSLSVVVLHAGVERRLMTDPQSSTWQARDTIARTGRTALTELRHLLGLLHETGDTPLQPLPSLGDLDTLVTALRAAGHQVSVEVTGDPAQLPTGIDLSAYRILQEAVTNALKHAPGSTVAVRVEHRPDAVAVEVTNHAPDAGTGPRLEGGGRGLVGMRERVRMFGGQLTAAPTEAGGFRVRATLPREAV